MPQPTLSSKLSAGGDERCQHVQHHKGVKNAGPKGQGYVTNCQTKAVYRPNIWPPPPLYIFISKRLVGPQGSWIQLPKLGLAALECRLSIARDAPIPARDGHALPTSQWGAKFRSLVCVLSIYLTLRLGFWTVNKTCNKFPHLPNTLLRLWQGESFLEVASPAPTPSNPHHSILQSHAFAKSLLFIKQELLSSISCTLGMYDCAPAVMCNRKSFWADLFLPSSDAVTSMLRHAIHTFSSGPEAPA